MGQDRHDAYLVDYRLGERDGLELLREAIARGCKAPIIILTSQGDQAVDVAAMQAGAADFLVKGEITARLLGRAICYAIVRKRAEEELRQSYVKLQRALEGTVHTLVATIELRDPYTAGHQRQVAQLACAMA